MKKFSSLLLFILLSQIIFISSSCSGAAKPYKKSNKTPTMRNKVLPSSNIQISGIKFYFKPDSEIFFAEIKDQAAKVKKTTFLSADLARLYKQAYDKASEYQEFCVWNKNNGDSPYIFDTIVSVLSKDKNVLFNTKVIVEIKAKMGELLIDPDTMTSNFDHLEKSAVWKKWRSYQYDIPALVPDQPENIKISALCLIDLIGDNSTLWPEELLVNVKVVPEGRSFQTKSATLKIIPDQFRAAEFLY